jgi:hypothetical protein
LGKQAFVCGLANCPEAFLEKIMRKILSLSFLMLTVLLACLYASTKKAGYQTATVVSVDKHISQSNYGGGGATDAPLQADDYSYDIGIRLNCNVYLGRYESATDYLPAVFARDHSVDVRLDKHIMYVSLPDSDREVKMGIVGHKRTSERDCPVNG